LKYKFESQYEYVMQFLILIGLSPKTSQRE